MSAAGKLDPQLAVVVAALRARRAPPPFSGTPDEARARMRDAVLTARERLGLPEVLSVEDTVAAHGDIRVPVRVYRPRSRRQSLPTVVFFHGGGFVLGSVELMDDIARKLCRDAEVVVVSVDYRLAPEHPFPAAHDDALAATLWALANATALGGDPARVAVAGESAGGNLAASSAILARDRGFALAGQLLVVPGVDFARDTLRLESHGRTYPMLTPHDLREVARLYLGTAAGRATGFPPSPLHCADLGGLPATVLAVAGCDPLHGEGLDYAERLQAAGVPTQVLRYEDMFHPFFGFFEISDAARHANDEICRTFAAICISIPTTQGGPEMSLSDSSKALRQAADASVHSVDRFVFSVPDLQEAERFYRAFGLDVRREGNRLALHTFGHSHCWAWVHESGQPKKLEYVRYGMHGHELGAMRERIVTANIEAQPHPLGDAEGIWLTNPDGTLLQIVAAPKVSPSQKCQQTGPPPVRPGHGAAPARSHVQQVRPRYLSHVLFFTPDVPRMIRFSQAILGLRLSDHSGDLIASMHGAHGSDHHLVAFAKSHAPGLHHSSWDVGSIDEVGRGSEQMRNAGHAQGWGVGRHVLGSNYFYYVRDPWGSYAEYSYDIDFVPAGSEWPAADHPPEDSLYVWGPSLPSDFITNLEQLA